MQNQSGQSLVELLIAMTIFVLAVSSITFIILDVYLTDRVGRERTIATFLAKEGIEATISVRDNNWGDLINGEHGLTIIGNRWVFQGSQEDVSNQLKEGKRKITVEEIDADRKKITSELTWRLTESRPQEFYLITYLTNWSKSTVLEDCSSYCQSAGYSSGTCRKNPRECSKQGEIHEPGGDGYCIGGALGDTCCCRP